MSTTTPELNTAEEAVTRFTLRQRLALWFISWTAYLLIWIIGSTLRFTFSIEEPDRVDGNNIHTLIAPFWHRCVFPATYFFRNRGFTVMTSRSFDGEYIARIIQRFGFKSVRGSSSRGGSEALLAMHDIVRNRGVAVFTIDGPRGPRYVAKRGPVILAKNTGVPIMPFYVAVERAWVLNSWDAFMIPKPFSKVFIRFGKFIDVPADADELLMDEKHAEMQRGLEEVRDYANAHVGTTHA